MTRRATVWAVMVAMVGAMTATAGAQYLSVHRYVAAGYVVRVVQTRLIHKGTAHYAADHVMYHPVTGTVVVGITKHPQRSGYNGAVIAPGDCWASFETGLPGAAFSVADLDGDGRANDILLHRQDTGEWREYAVTLDLFPGCDTTGAF